VVPDTLVGWTSNKLRNVTWRQIFNEVLSPQKYTFVEDQNIIRVVSQDSLIQQPTRPEVFILNYARANEILPTISRMVDTTELVKGSIQVDQRNNALVITERPSQLEKIKPIIEKLDVATAQVMIESKFVDVTSTTGRDVGVNWATLGSGLTVGTSAITATPARVSSLGTAGTYQTNATTGQPVLDANGNKIWATYPTPPTYGAGVVSNNVGDSLRDLFSAPSLLTASFNASEFNAVLKALNTSGSARLVSNPTLVTLNNVEATVNVGDEYPIPNYTYNQEKGSFEVAGFTFRPLGVVLKVTPHVNSAGFIKM